MNHPCSRCGAPRDTTGRYCRSCRAAYMRDRRAAAHDRLDDAIASIESIAAGGLDGSDTLRFRLFAVATKLRGARP